MISTVAHIIQISDTHFSPLAPSATEQWERILPYITAQQPDLVVHTGDISLNGAGDASEFDFALDLIGQLPVRWLAVPGNHDVGDVNNAVQPITGQRQDAYAQRFGSGFWCQPMAGWTLIGVDIQTLSHQHDRSQVHWGWLEDQLQAAVGPVAMFMHRPLRPDPGSPGALALDTTDQWYVLEPARTRLRSLLEGADTRVVASGHLHQPHHWRADNTSHVWAASTWAYLDDEQQPKASSGGVAVVHHYLEDDGAYRCQHVKPDDAAQLVFDRDFVSPYRSLFAYGDGKPRT